MIVAVIAAIAFTLGFISPIHTLRITHPGDVVAYVVFLAVAIVVGGLVSDQSDRRRTAQQAAAEMRELHDELVAVTADARRIEVLEQVDRHRAALLRSVSHDLRTPLVTIRGVATDLRSEDVHDEPTRLRLLDLLIDEAERLDRIVANLLSLSRIEAGELRPERHELHLDELIDSVTRRLARLLVGATLEISIPDELPCLVGDAVLIDQVLSNLLENAIRHAGRPGIIRIKVEPIDRWLAVTVADEGPGIDPNIRHRVFEPWTAGAASSSSGVGLAICRSIVEAHRGNITTHDEAVGAAFTFTLPILGQT